MKRSLFGALLALMLGSACVHPAPRPEQVDSREEGLASWYGAELAGHVTANGEKFDPTAMTAAHRSLAFGTCVRVELVAESRFIEVRINDRGPYVNGRIIDLSEAAARALGTWSKPPALVRLGDCGGRAAR